MNNQRTNTLPSANSNKKSNSNTSNTARPMQNLISAPVETVKSNPVTAIVLGVVFLVILYVIFTYTYDYYKTNRQPKSVTNYLLKSAISGTSQYDISSSDMPSGAYSNEYALSFWMYVDDYTYRQNQRKFIMRRGSIKSKANPEIYLHPNQNKLQVNVSLMTNNSVATPESSTTTTQVAGTTSTQVAGTTSTQSISTTTTKEEFTDMLAPGLVLGARSASTCDCDQTRDSQDILAEISTNNPNVPATYDGQFFSMVSGNKVSDPSKNNKGMLMSQTVPFAGIELTKEHFGATDAASCACPEAGVKETDADRKAFEDSCGKCVVPDFPLQKWVHVVVCQYNQVLDIYIDGKLKSSCVLPGFPDVVQENLVLCPDEGFSGMISKVSYSNTIYTAKDVGDLYREGPESMPGNIVDSVPTWGWVLLVVLILGAIAWSVFA
jgi:hypothetical protein